MRGGTEMRKTLIRTGAAILAAGLGATAFYFCFANLHTARAPPPWVAVPHRPGERLTRGTRFLRAFGPWRLTCNSNSREPEPKFGVIQNFEILPPQDIDTPSGCIVGVRMLNRLQPKQSIVLDFRFGLGRRTLMVNVLYPQIFGIKGRDVALRLSKGSIKLGTVACTRGRCIAHAIFTGLDLDTLTATQQLVVQLPVSQRGERSEVEIPAQELGFALAAVRNLTPS
jgi:invasion protein IalB